MVLLDLLGRRWALRALWELRDERLLNFRELQAACGHISSSVLNERLRELRAAGILTRTGGRGYELTGDGQSLLEALAPNEAWSTHWAERRWAEDPQGETAP
jgi:DNA-binding HxlR family transcriptional regulator